MNRNEGRKQNQKTSEHVSEQENGESQYQEDIHRGRTEKSSANITIHVPR